MDDDFYSDISSQFKLNLKALGRIENTPHEDLKKFYILSCLINNAKRRAEERKYDDAIARLYRSLELIAQIKLENYQLNSSNINIATLKKKGVSDSYIEGLNKIKSKDGKIKIGLENDFLLLNELGCDFGKYFVKHRNEITSLTSKRNQSILAHGLESQSYEDYIAFEEVVVNLAKKIDKKMKIYLKETKFPKFEV